MKYKVDDRVRDNDDVKGTILEVDEASDFQYKVRDDNGSIDNYRERGLTKITPTLEDMPEGTVVESDEYDTTRKVLFVLKPGLYVMSYLDELDRIENKTIFTAAELVKIDYKIKEDDMVTITVEGETKRISRQSAEELNLI